MLMSQMSGDTEERGEGDWTWTLRSGTPMDPVEDQGLWLEGSEKGSRVPVGNGNRWEGSMRRRTCSCNASRGDNKQMVESH